MRRNTHVEKIIKSLEPELKALLENNYIHEIKYPINFENDLGIFEFRENNSLAIQTKKGVDYLVLNVNILPSDGNS